MRGRRISLWSTSSLARRLSWVELVKRISYNYQQSSCDYDTISLPILSLFHLIVTEMERRIRMGPIEFISSLGGLFGLCLGFSFISFFEIIYWATIALSRFELKCDRFCHLFCSGTIGGGCPRIDTLLDSQQDTIKAHLKKRVHF